MSENKKTAKPVRKITNKKPAYEAGERCLRLKNKWAKMFDDDGLAATVKSVGHDRNGEVRYTIEITRKMEMTVSEDELGK